MQPTPTTPPSTRSTTNRTSRAWLGAGTTLLLAAVLASVAPSTSAAAATAPAAVGTARTGAVQSPATQNEVDAALERLRADGMLIDADTTTAKPDITLTQASTFGRSLFNGIAFAGGQVIMSEVLTALGYDPDAELNNALKEISDSIAALNDEVRKISQQVEQVLEGQDRTNFYNSYTQAGTAAANLETALRSVNGWIERDLQPSEANLSDIQTVTTTSIGQLDFILNNPTTGAVPLMMKAAEPAGVSDLENYWAQIDMVRDDYRAVLAQGLATLSLMERWDTTGTIAADLATFTPQAKTTVADMYGYGIALGTNRLHSQNSTEILLPLGTAPATGELGSHTIGNRDQVEPLLQSLAANYHAEDHGGQTLEATMQARGLPTSINFSDTYTAEVRNVRWTSLNLVGRIRGNSYEVFERHFGNSYSQLDPRGAQNAFTQASMQRLRDGHGALCAHVALNVGGRAADFTPSRLEQAAFGLG